jgi:hypothetical protein
LVTVVARAWLSLDAVGESAVRAPADRDVGQTLALIPFGPRGAVIAGALPGLDALPVAQAVSSAHTGDAITLGPSTPNGAQCAWGRWGRWR